MSGETISQPVIKVSGNKTNQTDRQTNKQTNKRTNKKYRIYDIVENTSKQITVKI